MRRLGRPTIFVQMLAGLALGGVTVTGLLLFADHVVRQSADHLEQVVMRHVRPLAAAQRLQSRVDTLRALELELPQVRDYFAVTQHLELLQAESNAVGTDITRLGELVHEHQAADAQRLREHWQLYRADLAREIDLARAMDMKGAQEIARNRSSGAHATISAILRDLTAATELAAQDAYDHARNDLVRQQQLFVLVWPAALVFLAVGLWLFARSISARVRELRDAASAIARGDRLRSIEVPGDDELTDLGAAFDAMRQQVQEREADLRSAQEHLRQRAYSAEEATRTKSQFLANMSHEIRTPMNGVLGMLELLRETQLSGEQRDCLDTAHESAVALLVLLNDILDLSKIEAGKIRLEEIDFDLEHVIEDSVALMAERALAKGLELTTTFAPDVPSRVRGDPTRLRQVLNNLLSNAIKFTESGSVGITVRRTVGDQGNARMRIEVRDTGIGIAPELQHAIFEPFTQADGSTTRRFGGTGLGLTISRHLVDAMGGHLGIESAPGRGSLFWFTLPLVPAANASAPPEDAPLRGVRALVVDHQRARRGLLVRMLSNWGVQASGAESLAAALEACGPGERPAAFDVILVEDSLPDGGGLGAGAALRARKPAVPMVLIKPVGRSCDPEEAAANGFRYCLSRPLRQSLVLNCLLELLGPGDRGYGSALPDRPAPSRVLLVEDNPVNQKVAVAMLHRIGCATDVAADGREALLKFQKQAYDLVLMDCQMPDMDGFAATAAMRGQELPGQHTPIVAMTAHAMPGDRERCLAAGMDDYLTKPVTLARLRAVLDHWHPLQPGGGTAAESDDPKAGRRIDELREALGDGFVEVVRAYLQDAPGRLRACREAIAAGDRAALRQAAHGLKGSSLNLAANRLAARLQQLEGMADGDATDAELGRAFQRVEAEWPSVERSLSRLARGA